MDENGMSNIIGSLIRNNGENSLGGGNAIWVIFLLFLFCGGGFGWNGNRGNFATQSDVTAGFANQNMENAIRANGEALHGLGVQSMGQANNLQQAINQATDWMQAGFANTNNNICNLKYELAQQTNAITNNATCNTQSILSKLTEMEQSAMQNTIAQLRSDLQAAQLTLGNAAQTQTIISNLKPNPVPAYVVSSPYATLTTGTTFG